MMAHIEWKLPITTRYSMEKPMRKISKPATGRTLQHVTTHPGEVLLEEFLKPLEISQHKLAMDLRVPATRIGEIVHGRRAVTPETSLRLARYFGNSPEFWLNLQQNFDLTQAKLEQEEKIARVVQVYTG
jgi:addiction module HigA family antidote